MICKMFGDPLRTLSLHLLVTQPGIREGVLVCRKALRSTPQPKDAAALVRALATVDANLDRFARLDAGEPTDITEDRRTDGELIRQIERALADPSLRAAFEEQRASE